MAHYDFLVAGCGMFGATFAQQVDERGFIYHKEHKEKLRW